MTGFRFVSWVCFHANFIAGAAQQLGQQFTYWDCRLHHNGEAVVPWFFREGPAFVTNASGSEKLHMALAAELRAIGGVRAGMLPPKTARTEQVSNIALDQSIRESRESQSSNAKWIKSQMPASCQSRKRLQQVIPEPQPNS